MLFRSLQSVMSMPPPEAFAHTASASTQAGSEIERARINCAEAAPGPPAALGSLLEPEPEGALDSALIVKSFPSTMIWTFSSEIPGNCARTMNLLPQSKTSSPILGSAQDSDLTGFTGPTEAAPKLPDSIWIAGLRAMMIPFTLDWNANGARRKHHRGMLPFWR